MVDSVTIESALSPVNDLEFQHPSPIVVSRRNSGDTATHIFVIYSDATALRIARSTDGGVTWGESTLQATTGIIGISCWYDRWTPGDTTGDIIHVAGCNGSALDDYLYFSWNSNTNAVGGTTNITIESFTTVTGTAASNDGQTSICKGANGSLYAACNATSPAGWHVEQSTDSGATWGDITAQGTSFNTDYNQVADQVYLIPCSTTDDIMAICYDDSQNQLEYKIYDDSANSWSAATTIDTLIETGALSGSVPSMYGATLDKTTSDIYLVYWKRSGVGAPTGGDVTFRKFTVSTGTWSNPVKIMIQSLISAENGANVLEMQSVSIERDQTNGFLMCYYSMGNQASDIILLMKCSSDDGQTWSDDITPQIVIDDLRKLSCPLVMNSVSEGWYCVWTNDDLDDLLGLNADPTNTSSATIPYKTLSGNVKDNSGTNVQGAVVGVYKRGFDSRLDYGKENPFMGSVTTDSSGNYKCLVVEFFGADSLYDAKIYYDRAEQEIFKNSTTDANPGTGSVRVCKLSGLTSGDEIIGISIKTASIAATNMRIKAYDEVSSQPTNLLGESGSVSTKGENRVVKFTTPVTVPANGIVWVGFEIDVAGILFEVTSGQPSGTEKFVSHTYGAGPDPFGSPTNATLGYWMKSWGNPMVDASIVEFQD